jgi:hypothetical protein
MMSHASSPLVFTSVLRRQAEREAGRRASGGSKQHGMAQTSSCPDHAVCEDPQLALQRDIFCTPYSILCTLYSHQHLRGGGCLVSSDLAATLADLVEAKQWTRT